MRPPFITGFRVFKIILLKPIVMMMEIFGHIIFVSKLLTSSNKTFLSPKYQNTIKLNFIILF